MRGQTRDAQSDQRNPGKSRKRGAYPLRRCPKPARGRRPGHARPSPLALEQAPH
jgi:hypothetical protein